MFYNMANISVKDQQNNHRSVFFFDILYYLCHKPLP